MNTRKTILTAVNEAKLELFDPSSLHIVYKNVLGSSYLLHDLQNYSTQTMNIKKMVLYSKPDELRDYGWVGWYEEDHWANHLSSQKTQKTNEQTEDEDETFKLSEERRRAIGSPLKPQLLFVVVKAT